jgi:hypothetical protein
VGGVRHEVSIIVHVGVKCSHDEDPEEVKLVVLQCKRADVVIFNYISFKQVHGESVIVSRIFGT